MCGQGRLVRPEVPLLEGSEAGKAGVSGGEAREENGVEWCGRGVVLVEEVLMKCVMRSGTVSGVTLSIIVKEGRRRTEV